MVEKDTPSRMPVRIPASGIFLFFIFPSPLPEYVPAELRCNYGVSASDSPGATDVKAPASV